MADDAKYKLPAEQEANLKRVGIENVERGYNAWRDLLEKRWQKVQNDEMGWGDEKYKGSLHNSTIESLKSPALNNPQVKEVHTALNHLYQANAQQANLLKVDGGEDEIEKLREAVAQNKEYEGYKKYRGKPNYNNRAQQVSPALWAALSILFGTKNWSKYNPGAAENLKNALKDLKHAEKSLDEAKRAKFSADLSPIEDQTNNNAEILPLADAQARYEVAQDNLLDTGNEIMSAMPPEQLRELQEQIMDNPLTAVSIGDDDSAQANPLTISNNPSIPAR